MPGFLDLPARPVKPRSAGLTHVLDKLTPLRLFGEHLEAHGHWIDIVKVGWGLGYLDTRLAERARVCRLHGVALCTGGTFLEVAAHRGRVPQFRDWALRNEVSAVEVSNGLGLMSEPVKHDLVAQFADDFVVLAETGLKNGSAEVDGTAWAAEMKADLDAGAAWVVTEGRESGTVGLYQADGAIREELVCDLLGVIDPDRILFEAPRKAQQTWLIEQLGPNVNLGNIDLAEVPSVESLRLGLRADTALQGWSDDDG
jgi:phosphosulfolactate synthase